MCGIAGEFVCDSDKRIDSSLILPIVSAIRHRGPDEWGYYVGCGGAALLINTRLSIVDLESGKQPLSNEDGSVWDRTVRRAPTSDIREISDPELHDDDEEAPDDEDRPTPVDVHQTRIVGASLFDEESDEPGEVRSPKVDADER